ncbi:MAG TPA: hypothetical protein PKC85_12250 [Bacteroidia bacterium]|nr:hypothetical protein [Bacteroidia bacterium]HMU20600.1 hypothetical protein [Bacteroidia bacterium]
MKTSSAIIYSLIALFSISGCTETIPDIYYNLNFCDTCKTIGGAIQFEKQNNSVQLMPMPEEELYLSIFHYTNTEFYIRDNRTDDGRIIYSEKYFIQIDTVFKLKILKVYRYPLYNNEDSLLNRLLISNIRVKVFHTDPIIDSIYNLPQFIECKYDTLKGIYSFLNKSYNKLYKEKYGEQNGKLIASDEIYKSKKHFPLKEDIKRYVNSSDNFGIWIDFSFNFPKIGRYEKYKYLSPEDMSIYLNKTIHYKNHWELKEAGYIF